jgi:hypothetical protein
MRIAISGSHRSGKTTLIEELAALLPKYETVEEPYHLMEEDGYEFCDPPSLEDFEAQLECSMQLLGDGAVNTLFDRCPADFIAYISVHEHSEQFDFDEWLPRVQRALRKLDVIVLVPIEDDIVGSSSDDGAYSRAAVDEKLQEILLDDPFELGVEVLVVEGDLDKRVRTVMQRISRGSR